MRARSIPAGLPRWPGTALPAGLGPATARLSARLQARIDADGAVRDPCRSRVLESALMLALLEHADREPAAQGRLAGYLAAHRNSSDPLDRLLAAAALGGRTASDQWPDVDRFLARAPGFTAPRKRAFLDMVRVLLAAAPVPPLPAPEAFSLHGLHVWARVQTIAVKTVLSHAHGGLGLVSKGDLDLLRSTQAPATVWEGNLLIHLSVLHALARVPGHEQLLTDGIRTALTHQRPDGGLPFICDEDTWLTATAGVALHAAAAPAPILAAVARRLTRLQQPGGGWSYTESARLADVDCTSVAAEVLHLAHPGGNRPQVGRAVAALHALRGKDGGFPTYLADAPSEACMTAAAVNALSTQGTEQRATIDAALSQLASQQHPDGSFPPDWSSSRMHTVFRATLAASHQPHASGSPAHQIIQRATHLVLSSQNTDGGWGQQAGDNSDALSTAYALITLSRHAAPAPAAHGVAYLLTQQRADGSIVSIPDSIGPRPFGFTVPALADAFTLLALGHLARRLAPAPLARTSATAHTSGDAPLISL